MVSATHSDPRPANNIATGCERNAKQSWYNVRSPSSAVDFAAAFLSNFDLALAMLFEAPGASLGVVSPPAPDEQTQVEEDERMLEFRRKLTQLCLLRLPVSSRAPIANFEACRAKAPTTFLHRRGRAASEGADLTFPLANTRTFRSFGDSSRFSESSTTFE
mmetsp:Transcript_13232/g.39029  ORF Transcript_13232/g.39029 Transcript_13232/m.39029 type:complete len:161 (+) Transcript_13232:261-743(+)